MKGGLKDQSQIGTAVVTGNLENSGRINTTAGVQTCCSAGLGCHQWLFELQLPVVRSPTGLPILTSDLKVAFSPAQLDIFSLEIQSRHWWHAPGQQHICLSPQMNVLWPARGGSWRNTPQEANEIPPVSSAHVNIQQTSWGCDTDS